MSTSTLHNCHTARIDAVRKYLKFKDTDTEMHAFTSERVDRTDLKMYHEHMIKYAELAYRLPELASIYIPNHVMYIPNKTKNVNTYY